MSMTREQRARLHMQQELLNAAASKRGQAEAERYLRSRELPPTRGNIRAGVAFAILSIAAIIIALAL